MFKKIGIIVLNFFKSSRKVEILQMIIFPLFFTVLLFLFFNNKIINFNQFSDNFNDTIVSIASLLSAFGLTAISLFITSSSENIKAADKTMTDRVDRRGKRVSLYKLQLFRAFFSLLVQAFLLLISVVFKFFCEGEFYTKPFFYFEVWIFFIAIISQIQVIISMYFMFIKARYSEE